MGIVIIVTLVIIHYLRKYWKEQEKEKKEDGMALLDVLQNRTEESFKSLGRRNDVMNAKKATQYFILLVFPIGMKEN